jgi:YgiT-type zinc finger domain-containing protein
MNCVVCRHGETRPGTTTVTLQRDGCTLVVNEAPADVCENCGEAYVDEAVTERLLEMTSEARHPKPGGHTPRCWSATSLPAGVMTPVLTSACGGEKCVCV